MIIALTQTQLLWIALAVLTAAVLALAYHFVVSINKQGEKYDREVPKLAGAIDSKNLLLKVGDDYKQGIEVVGGQVSRVKGGHQIRLDGKVYEVDFVDGGTSIPMQGVHCRRVVFVQEWDRLVPYAVCANYGKRHHEKWLIIAPVTATRT